MYNPRGYFWRRRIKRESLFPLGLYTISFYFSGFYLNDLWFYIINFKIIKIYYIYIWINKIVLSDLFMWNRSPFEAINCYFFYLWQNKTRCWVPTTCRTRKREKMTAGWGRAWSCFFSFSEANGIGSEWDGENLMQCY